MSDDDEAIRRILTSGKAESDRRAARGFPPDRPPDADWYGTPREQRVESSGGGGGNWVASLLIAFGWAVFKIMEFLIPILIALFVEAMKLIGRGIVLILSRR